MKATPAPKLSVELIAEANHRARHYVDLYASRALKLLHDPDRAKRLEAGECVACFYLRGDRICGQAFTEWECGQCGKQDMHSNTGTPKFCADCSWKYCVCTQCGADLGLRPRRKIKIMRRVKRRAPS